MPNDGFSIDSTDFGRLVADVTQLPTRAGAYLSAAMEVAGANIRDIARENSRGIDHAPQFPQSITYDFVGDRHGGGVLGAFIGGSGRNDLEMEIGPDKDRPQGALGNLLEYGSVNNPPQGIMHGALQQGEPDYHEGVQKAIDDGLRSAGFL